jgi:hypothetical protein
VSRRLLARTRLVVTALAVIGMLIGVLVAYLVTTRAERYSAQATLAMVPAADVPPDVALDFWEVLNRGQATRSAAVALGDARWLAGAASATGLPASELSLSAGAIPDTTLITVTMEANSAWAAEAALDRVLADSVGYAAKVSGPFKLETIGAAYGSANTLSPDRIQSLATLGISGLMVGAGVGFLISRSAQGRSAHRDDEPERVDVHEQIPEEPSDEESGEPAIERNGKPLSVKRL